MKSNQLRVFKCSCCGSLFRAEASEQAKFGKDHGYGMCHRCAGEQALANELEWMALEQKVAKALNPTNSRTFLNFELEVRRGIILSMIDEGLITFEVRRGGH